MATDLERLIVSMEARTASFEREMKRAQTQVSNVTRKIEADFTSMNSRMKGLLESSTSIVQGGFAKIAALAAGAISGKALIDYADAWQKAANKIAAAGESASGVGPRLSQLTDIALRSRTGLDETVDLYTALRRSTEDLKPSQAQLVKATENVNKAFVVGGQGAQAQAAGILQLGQALQSGVLQGDELRSIRENAPLIAKAIADTMGQPLSKLKELGEQGKITSDIVLQALLNMGAGVEAQFARTVPTVEQSLASLRTNVTRFIGQLDQQTGASAKLAGRIMQVSDAITTIGPAAATTAIAILETFGGAQSWFNPIVAGATTVGTALALIGDSIRPVADEFATLGDYAVAAFRMAREAGGPAWEAVKEAVQSAADTINSVFASLPGSSADSFGMVLSAVKTVVNAIIGAFLASGQAISASWSGMTAGLAEQMVNAMNAAIAAVEGAIQKIVAALNGVTSAIPGSLIPTIPAPQLGRITNSFAGAGAAAGQAFRDSFGALTRDYIGDTINAVDGALQRIRQRANEVATDRTRRNFRQGEADSYNVRSDGRLDQKLTPPPRKDEGGGGGGGDGAKKQNEFERELASLEKRIVALGREREALSLSAFEAARAEASFKLLDAAKTAGIPVTEELKGKIGELSDAYARTKVALDEAKQSQEAFAQLQQFIGTSLSGFFSDIISGGENAQKALMNLVKRLAEAALQAAILGQGPLADILGLAPSGGKKVGGLLGALFTSFGRAGGGPVRAGQPYTVGEHGREMFVPQTNGRIISNRDLSGAGGGQAIVINADFRGADMAAVNAINGKLDALRVQLPGIIMKTQADAAARGMRF